MAPSLIAVFAFGCFFVASLLLIAVFIPEPTNQQMFVFRVVLALAAACVGAIVPGFLEIQGKVLEFSLRAGGALGLFLIIYLINPPGRLAKPTEPKLGRPVRRKVPESLINEDSTTDEGSSG